MDSGCGCAKPVLSAKSVDPGELLTVAVQVTGFPVGERVVAITLETDSRRTPIVTLSVKMLGSVPPPFIHVLTGDLTFESGAGASERREVKLFTVERGPRQQTPKLTSDLPGLRLVLDSIEEKPYVDPGTFERIYKFTANFDDPPSGTFAGEVVARDPWIEGRSLRLLVHGKVRQSVRVVPNSVRLDLRKD